MRKAPAVLLGVVLAWTAGPVATAQDGDAPAAGETKRVQSPKGEVAFDFPGSWLIEREEPTDGEHLHLLVRMREGERAIRLRAFTNEDVRNPRGRVVYEFPHQLRFDETTVGERVARPFDHLWTKSDRPPHPYRRLLTFRLVNRVGLAVLAHVPEPQWEEAYPALLAVIGKETTSLQDVAGGPPEGYRKVERDGWRYLLAPGVKDADVKPLHDAISAVEKSWAARWGPVPKPPENPPEVLLHARREDAEAFVRARNQKPWSKHGVFDQSTLGQLVAARLPPNEPTARADLAYAVTRVLQAQTFDRCAWLRQGEAAAAWMEARIGKALPAYPDVNEDQIPTVPKRLAELLPLDMQQLMGHEYELAAYFALLRQGPKPYQDAWAQFVAEMRRTGDWDAAAKPLLALDQEQLVSDYVQYRTKTMKAVRAK